MSEPYSTPEPASRKPEAESEPPALPRVPPTKPYPDYPLRAHALGYWCKKIRGKLYYFGKWDDPDGALQRYLEQKDDLHAGRTPRSAREALVVKEAINAFLNAKQRKVESGELSERSWQEYKVHCDSVVAAFGKRRRVADLGPDDFGRLRQQLAARFGPVRLGNVIQTIRSAFKFAYEADLLDRPVRYGPDFQKPSKKTLRLHRAKKGTQLFTPEEIGKLLDAASVPLKAMILLGINAALGPSDCARLPQSAINLKTGWLDYPRVKTGVPRRCWLWPETIRALAEALASRPEPKDPKHAGLVFITKFGDAWVQTAITNEIAKLLKRQGINGHRGHYCLRHTFRTIGDETRDQVACNAIMGHTDNSMAGVYRERVGDDRLQIVSEHVRQWLFGSKPADDEPTILKMEQTA
jgi:integrase